MTKFISYIRKNNKKALAILGVLCMISFVATMSYSGNSGPQTNAVRGKVGSIEFRESDLREADGAIRTLRALFQDRFGEKNDLVERMKPETFMLLLHEARQMRVSPSEDEVQGVLQQFRRPQVQEGEPAPKEIKLSADQEQAIRDWLLITGAGRVAGDASMVSLALRARQMEQQNQKVGLKLVEFKAAWFTAPSTMPATQPAQFEQEVQKQFEKYKDVDPRTDDFGFGYKYPDRVKLQYIELRREDVKKAILKDTHRLKKFYNENAKSELFQYPTSEPSTKPSPEALDERGMQRVPEVKMTTRPYGDKDVMDRIAERLTLDDMDWIYAEINKTVASDGAAFREAMKSARSSTSPTTEPELLLAGPPSSLGVPFNSRDYLTRLADKIEGMHPPEAVAGVRPVVESIGDFNSAEDLGHLEEPAAGLSQTVDARSHETYVRGLQQANRALQQGNYQLAQAIWQMLDTVRQQALSLPRYAIGLAEPIINDPAKIRQLQTEQKPTLPLWQFSARMVNPKTGDLYTFRISAVSLAHAPASMDEPVTKKPTIRERVEEDVRGRLAYEEAERQAKAFLAQAEASNLQQAAKAWQPLPATQPIVKLTTQPTTNPAAGLPVLPTGLFTRDDQTTGDYPVFGPDVQHLEKGAFSLLDEKNKTSKTQPMGVIGLPRERMVVVAQLAEVEPLRQNEWGDAQTVAATDNALKQRMMGTWGPQWFSPEAVAARLKYQAMGGGEPKKSDQRPQDGPMPSESPFN